EDGTNWAIIADVTGDVYVLPAEDVGFKLRLRIKQEYNESWQNELLSNVIDLTNTISINNAEFDSLTYNFKAELTSDIAIPNGIYITAICNNKTYSVGVSGGKVSFNLAESFLRGTKGGQNYSVTFSARGTKGDTVEIGYWPIVSYEITTPEEVTIYNGAADKFESPEWTLINYEPNSVTMNMWFKLYTNYGTDSSAEITSIDTSNWQLSDMKTFLTDLNNDGKTIEANFSITPNCTDGESLAADGYVVYHCKKDVLVKSAYIVNNYGDFEAHLYADETPSEESEAETAGGIVSYQWQNSEDAQNYTDIPNATEKTFSLTKENADSLIRKALRVKITQN
ncbi:MAG: hypothetical protein J6W76_07260, partial [Spirochaetales bacterium]|nr:hypothetical protein [Spirochaetales bacterium]